MSEIKDQVVAVFDEVADSQAWESLYKKDLASGDLDKTSYNFLVRRRAVGEMLTPYMEGDIIDIGCGSGDLVTIFAERASSYLGVDLSTKMIERANTIYKDLASRGNIKFEVADCESVPFENESFDITTSVAVIEYFPDSDRSLDEVTRLAKPGGHALVTVPYLYCIDRYLRILAKPFVSILYPAYTWLRRRPLKSMRNVKHHAYSVKRLDNLMKQRGFTKIDQRFTNFHLIPFPIDVLFPRLYIRMSERIDRSGNGARYKLFASNYIALYRKSG